MRKPRSGTYVKNHVHARRGLEVESSAPRERHRHPGWIRDGKPFVDEPVMWLKLKQGSVFETILYLDPADARRIANEILAAVEQTKIEPTECPGGCGYGCVRRSDGTHP